MQVYRFRGRYQPQAASALGVTIATTDLSLNNCAA